MTGDDQIISTKLSHVPGFCRDDDQIISIKESICHQWIQWLPPPHKTMSPAPCAGIAIQFMERGVTMATDLGIIGP